MRWIGTVARVAGRPRARLEDDVVLDEVDALAKNDAVARRVPLNALDGEQVIEPAVEDRHVVRGLVGDEVAVERDGDRAGAGVIDDVGAVGRIIELGLPAVDDVEPGGPVKEVVVLSAVGLLDALRIEAAHELVAATPAEQRREGAPGPHGIVAAGAEQRRGSGRQVHAIGKPLRRIEPGVMDERGDRGGGVDRRRGRAGQAVCDIGKVLALDIARIGRHGLPGLELVALIGKAAAAAIARRSDLADELLARGEVCDRERRAAVGALDAEIGAVARRLAHAFHHEPIVLPGRGLALVLLVDELQVVEAEKAQTENLHGNPFDADSRHVAAPWFF
jgi:hypothetical protein